jgi:hypothetical protein
MRTNLILALLILVSCSKNMPASYRDATSAQSTPGRSAGEPSTESSNAMIQAEEAQIERNLLQMGLPLLQDLEISTGITKNSNTGAQLYLDKAKDEKNAVPPSPTKEPTQPPKIAAPITANEEPKSKGESREEENSCQKTCNLISNICTAAERICQITETLPKDSGAPQRCVRARNACTRAQTQGASCPCSS